MPKYSIKQVIVVRRDLAMTVGKTAAQVAHASSKAILDMASVHSYMNNAGQYESIDMIIPIYQVPTNSISGIDNRQIPVWLDSDYPKIVLGIDSEEALIELQEKVSEAGIINSMITDIGYTELKGNNITCLSIGPDKNELIDQLTSKLKLL